MPRRSNEFQRLIHQIEASLAPVGATVEESAMVASRLGGTRREIDVLLSIPAGPRALTIAVECRDQARRADVRWIEELRGKYEDLPVDRVVAVSRRGFTREAREKAARVGIECRVLSEIHEGDWPRELRKMLASLTVRAQPIAWRLGLAEDRPSVLSATEREQAALVMGGEPARPIEEAVRALLQSDWAKELQAAVERDWLTVLGAGVGNEWTVEASRDLQAATLVVPPARRLPVERLAVTFRGRHELSVGPLMRYEYGPSKLAVGRVEVDGGAGPWTCVLTEEELRDPGLGCRPQWYVREAAKGEGPGGAGPA